MSYMYNVRSRVLNNWFFESLIYKCLWSCWTIYKPAHDQQKPTEIKWAKQKILQNIQVKICCTRHGGIRLTMLRSWTVTALHVIAVNQEVKQGADFSEIENWSDDNEARSLSMQYINISIDKTEILVLKGLISKIKRRIAAESSIMWLVCPLRDVQTVFDRAWDAEGTISRAAWL